MIRQAHPGPGAEPYRDLAQKHDDARRFKDDEHIPYPVLVDDLEGTTHQAYGGLADPTYLIDAEGRVAFYNMWTHAPTLHEALEELFAQEKRGVVKGGTDRIPHMAAVFADGWRGLRRGLPRSAIEAELSLPGSASGAWLGHQIRPLLAPIVLRAEPLPPAAKLGLAVAAIGVGALAVNILTRNRRAPDA